MMSPSYIRQQFATLFLPQAVGWLLSFKFPIASSPLLAMQAIVRPPTKRVLGLSLLVILLCTSFTLSPQHPSKVKSLIRTVRFYAQLRSLQ